MTEIVVNEPAGIVWRGADGYEQARSDLVWQLKKPDRYPAAIAAVSTEQEVVEAVRWARAQGLRVMARSGGHNWQGTSLRDGGLTLSLDAMQEIEVDVERMIARVGPGARVEVVDAALAEHGLFFPVGHCPTVALGGFLLGGGYGWWSQEYGQSCLSIMGVDVVTAAGELIHADEQQNSDYLWMARGSGPSFPGVITRFHLKLRPRFASIMKSTYIFPATEIEDVYRWAWEVREHLDGMVEFTVSSRFAADSDDPEKRIKVIRASITSAGSSEEEALGRLAPFLADREIRRRALQVDEPWSPTMPELFAMQDLANPSGFRYAVDNMWTDASADELLPLLREAYDWLPSEESLVLWYHWRPQPLPDAAVSTQAKLWISVYATYDDPSDDERHQRFVTDLLGRYQHLSPGTQISDENMEARFYNPISPESQARLLELRRRLDPEGVFHGFLGQPEAQ